MAETERAQIQALASDLPTLWHSPETSAADRKEIVRGLIDHLGWSEVIHSIELAQERLRVARKRSQDLIRKQQERFEHNRLVIEAAKKLIN